MSEQDHFAAALDEQAHDEPHEHREVESDLNNPYVVDEFETERPKKKSIPTPLLIVGGVVVFIVLGAGYQHFFGAKRQNQFASAPVMSLPADGGGMIPSTPAQAPGAVAPLPAQGGALSTGAGSAPPVSPQMTTAPEPVGPVPSSVNSRVAPVSPAGMGPASAQVPMDMGASSGAPDMTGSPTATAPATASAPAAEIGAASEAVAGAPATPVTTTPDPKDVEIAKLKAELKASQTHHGATLRHAPRRLAHAAPASDVSADAADTSDTSDASTGGGVTNVASHARHGTRGKHARAEVLVGFHIKQVIPGQGWVEDEQTGKQQVVAVGDRIGSAEVTKIDANSYKIETTAGVIQ